MCICLCIQIHFKCMEWILLNLGDDPAHWTIIKQKTELQKKNNIINFEVLTVVTSSTAFCDTIPSSVVDKYQHYRQMCCPHLQNQVSKKVPIKCWPIYQATWCHIPYSMLFQAVLAVMLLTCTWEWSNFNLGCDMSDFKAFHNFPQSIEENSTSVP